MHKMRSKTFKHSYKLSLQTEVHLTGILDMGMVGGGGGVDLWLVLGSVLWKYPVTSLSINGGALIFKDKCSINCIHNRLKMIS